ncbi:MAG: amidophosphoribosyltransferase, partial [Candidatus Marinimicrobia bacterium]|nr:amidophosphoribosyltransferase [Candidatus Neomarinimicrobiota bacterium]
DDSIVRGTTMRKLIKLVREAGAKAVHVRITSPPIRFPCHFGMDFPTEKELLAANKSVEEIRDWFGADSLKYLSIDGLLQSMDLPGDHFCTACFTGDYPIVPEEGSGKLMFETGINSMPGS